MKCFVCNGKMKKYFSKRIGWGGADIHEYVRCEICGLVIDKTAYETDFNELSDDIISIHSEYQGTNENLADPNWLERLEKQALSLVSFFEKGLFSYDMRIVDYGCGDGKLSEYFAGQYSKMAEDTVHEEQMPEILKYDKYMKPKGDTSYLSTEDMEKGSFDVVITCSVLEHLVGKMQVDEVLSLINDCGVFCLHTYVCEKVPQDPNWHYLLPDHVTIWTNRAMAYLYEQYGFTGCAFNLEARMWFFFRDKIRFAKLEENVGQLDGTWVLSCDFVDYWK